MRALAAASLLALATTVGAACGTPQDGTPDAGTQFQKVIVDLSGKADLHPAERAWRQATGKQSVSLEGATIAVEDALGATSGKPPLKTGTIAADGSWSVPQVDVTKVSLAVVGVVRDLPTIMESGFGIQRGRPEQSLTGLPLHVLSKEFVTHLEQASGIPELAESGFIFAQIVDAEGKGVAGAQLASISPSPKAIVPKEGESLVYLNADLSGTVDGATSSSGVVLFVPEMTQATEYTAVKEGSHFKVHLSGKRAGACISVFLEQE